MPKKFIKRYMPDHKVVREHRHLRIFGRLLHDPNLFHLNRRSVAGGFAVGLFFAWVPVPFQMVLAAALAIPLRVNLPISMALVWVSNPLTMPPMFYFAYVLGTWIIGVREKTFHFELTFEWLGSGLHVLWQPFLLGCFVMGVASSLFGYVAIRMLWRLSIVRRLKKKTLLRRSKSQLP